MSLDYTGDPTATQAPSPAPAQDAEPVGRLPVDGEAANVASIYQQFKALLDFSAWLTNNGVFKAAARTITAIHTFAEKLIANGASSSGIVLDTTSGNVANAVRPLWQRYIDTDQFSRHYVGNIAGAACDFYIVNGSYTSYNAGDLQFTRDTAGDPAFICGIIAGGFFIGRIAAPAATFTVTDFSELETVTTDGDVYAGRDFSATRDVLATRNVQATEDVVAVRALEAQTARSSATGGAGQGVNQGRIYKDGTILAWAQVSVNGTPACVLERGYNINTVSRIGAGEYEIVVVSGATNKLFPIATPYDGSDTRCVIKNTANTTTFRVLVYDAAGLPYDGTVNVMVLGG